MSEALDPEPALMTLPADDHVHTEFSWDADDGSMERTCARAVELGLPSVAFTEHVDQTRWHIPPELVPHAGKLGEMIAEDGRFDPPPMDVDGYLATVERCRAHYPSLRILTGVELGEPHWFPEQSGRLLASGDFDRVLGSQHSVVIGDAPWITDLAGGWGGLGPYPLVRTHLEETLRLVESDAPFEVLAHVDYAARAWPPDAAPFDPGEVEEELRTVLRALAASDRALEVNTRRPLDEVIVRWWHEEGGQRVTFGSDAHRPGDLANGFVDASAMVEAQGFRPGRHPNDPWRR